MQLDSFQPGASLHLTAKTIQPQAQTRQTGPDLAASDKIFKRRPHSHSLGPGIQADLLAQHGQPKTKHSGTEQAAPDRTFSSQIPASDQPCPENLTSQIKKNQTGHPSTARYNILASSPTCSEGSERDAGSDRTGLDQTSQLKPQCQTERPSSDWTFQPRRDNISPKGSQTTTKDQTTSDRTPKLRLARRSSELTSNLRPRADSLRQHRPTGNIQVQTRQPQRQDIRAQTEQAQTRPSS